jgi:uncharacterized protein involved in exopolysaccharide biosynthesis
MEEKKDNEVIGLKPIIIDYLLHWKLIIGVGLFAVIVAIFYLIFYPRTYETMARVQIQNGNNPLSGGGSIPLGEAAGLMRSFGLGGIQAGSIIIDDEISTFTSNALLSRMVYELGVYVDYSKSWTFGYRMYEESPLVVTCDSVSIAHLDNTIEFNVFSEKQVKIQTEIESLNYKETFQFASLPAVVSLKEGNFIFDYTDTGRSLSKIRLLVTVNPLTTVSETLVKDLLVEELSKTSNVIEFTASDYKKQRSKDMLNTLIRLYNEQETSYKKDLGDKSLLFLNDRIDQMLQELADVERAIEVYKSKNKITNVEMDVQYYVEYMKELQMKLIEAQQQTHLIKMLDAFVKDSANRYKLAPSLIASSPAMSSGQESAINPLTSYNQALLERDRLIKNSGIDNPMVSTLDVQIDKLRDNVYQMIENTYKSVQLTIDDLKEKEKEMKSRMGEVPEQERVYVDYRRQQEILQGVYLLLLQKREEILLSIGQPTDKAKVVDAAFTKPRPVAPRKLFAVLFIIIFTLIVSVGWLFCKEQTLSIYHGFREKQKSLKE